MFAWSDYLDLADELVARVDDEAAARSAISRAYYAAFGMARAYLMRNGLSIPLAGEAHKVVWDRFFVGPDSVHRRIADRGRRLRRWRSWADYDETYPRLSTDAEQATILARRLLADLASLP